MPLQNLTNEQYYLGPDGVWNSADEDYGAYQFISLKDIINNFIIAYVGEDKIISKIKRTDVAFHAQRGIQELNFDTLTSVKSQEIEVPPMLTMVLPHDYVNYVKISWHDDNGVEHLLYPAINTSNPKAVLQDDVYEYTFDQNGEILYAENSETWKKFKANNQDILSEISDEEARVLFHKELAGGRYGIVPQYAQANGVFFIDQVKGFINFSSDMINRVVTLKYISDGLAADEDTVVHKFAEEAIYKYIAHAILATRDNTQEYMVLRFKKEARAAKRNAKLRLSNIKLEEITQILRGKSKQIKH